MGDVLGSKQSLLCKMLFCKGRVQAPARVPSSGSGGGSWRPRQQRWTRSSSERRHRQNKVSKSCHSFMLHLKRLLETGSFAQTRHARFRSLQHAVTNTLKPKVSSFYFTSIITFFSLMVSILKLRHLALLSTFILS